MPLAQCILLYKQQGGISFKPVQYLHNKLSNIQRKKSCFALMGKLIYVAFPLILSFAVLSLCQGVAAAAAPPHPKLMWHYYQFNTTCRYAEEYVRHQVQLVWDHDKSITAKLLRLVYSDCFVTVCTHFFPFIYFGTGWYFLFPFFSNHFELRKRYPVRSMAERNFR